MNHRNFDNINQYYLKKLQFQDDFFEKVIVLFQENLISTLKNFANHPDIKNSGQHYLKKLLLKGDFIEIVIFSF